MFVVRLQNTTGVMTMKLYRVHGFGCGNREHDDDGFATKESCSEWCGDQDKCVVALRAVVDDNNGDFTVDEQACTHHIRERFKELHELKCEKVRAKAEGHSANTVGGPTPGAAPACEQTA